MHRACAGTVSSAVGHIAVVASKVCQPIGTLWGQYICHSPVNQSEPSGNHPPGGKRVAPTNQEAGQTGQCLKDRGGTTPRRTHHPTKAHHHVCPNRGPINVKPEMDYHPHKHTPTIGREDQKYGLGQSTSRYKECVWRGRLKTYQSPQGGSGWLFTYWRPYTCKNSIYIQP